MESMSAYVRPYKVTDQQYFEKFNRAWIEKYFWMEPLDFDILQHPDKHIIEKGGIILMAETDGKVVGTVALRFISEDVYEFTKMAVDENFQGRKIGKALVDEAIRRARALGASEIFLYSNTVLENAIAMYRKYGFQEVPVDGPYKRSNIKMKLVLK